ncbi:MAG: CRISPR-associated endonuclease Cas1 [candidate division WOR-3 bacterium]|jgi:CRISPR-associated protein Cas1|nr:CRISPR-associated endonuclease Cas1 [candidate division WOR-3 bacterium]MCR4424249.1 CRISPR-associated endonuclease Cas1 [candidate division WOR-3 bacterium]MDH7519333.1 CRISPR-associated endonuclease Cas1 [bacterium]
MNLVINTYGAYLQRQGDCFRVRVDDKVYDVACAKVSSILISTAAYLTTDAIKLAIDHNIDIIFIDEMGEPYARIWHSRFGSTTEIRRRQLAIAETEEGFNLALSWVKRKFDNQIELLKKLRTTRTRKSAQITGYIEKLENCRKQLDTMIGTIDEKRNTIMGVEGSGGRIYFQALSFLMPEDHKFEGRSRNPAKDEFNALLNYAYGILYSRVERACVIAGLDPYVGILHTDNYNKKSLVFDIIENYRAWAEEVVINLFAARKVKKEHFDQLENGYTLNKEGKALLIETFLRFLDESVRYCGRNIKRADIIQFDCHKIANSLLSREDESG